MRKIIRQYRQKGFCAKMAIVFLVLIFIFLLISIIGGYTNSYYFGWVGVSDYTPPKTSGIAAERGKTLWDWMELLIIPAVLAIGGYWLSKIEHDREMERRDEERRQEEKREEFREAEAADQIKENEWQTYLDKMTNLLEKGLCEADLNSPLRDIAKVRTLTTLRRLDGPRKGMLLLFLFDAALIIRMPTPVITFLGNRIADFKEADLRGATLSAMVFQETDKPKGNYRRGLSPKVKEKLKGDLSEPYPLETDLSNLPPEISMSGAVLVHVDLSEADLSKAFLIGVDLSNSLLVNADLRGATLTDANLSGAKLSGAKLNSAFLYSADLSKANLSGVDLSGARYNNATKWPEGFDPDAAGAKMV